jgi:hypothetical protein
VDPWPTTARSDRAMSHEVRSGHLESHAECYRTSVRAFRSTPSAAPASSCSWRRVPSRLTRSQTYPPVSRGGQRPPDLAPGTLHGRGRGTSPSVLPLRRRVATVPSQRPSAPARQLLEHPSHPCSCRPLQLPSTPLGAPSTRCTGSWRRRRHLGRPPPATSCYTTRSTRSRTAPTRAEGRQRPSSTRHDESAAVRTHQSPVHRPLHHSPITMLSDDDKILSHQRTVTGFLLASQPIKIEPVRALRSGPLRAPLCFRSANHRQAVTSSSVSDNAGVISIFRPSRFTAAPGAPKPSTSARWWELTPR